MIRFFHYDQVLTGVLPYGITEISDVIPCIRRGEKPSRPTDPTQNRWLHDPVWDMITTCWSDKLRRRCELPVMHHVFSTPSSQNAKPDEPGVVSDWVKKIDSQEVPNIGTEPQQRGKFLPRITSLFQFLRGSEPEIERIVDEMDKAGFSAFSPLPIPGPT
jgi:hypothetical protein